MNVENNFIIITEIESKDIFYENKKIPIQYCITKNKFSNEIFMSFEIEKTNSVIKIPIDEFYGDYNSSIDEAIKAFISTCVSLDIDSLNEESRKKINVLFSYLEKE